MERISSYCCTQGLTSVSVFPSVSSFFIGSDLASPPLETVNPFPTVGALKAAHVLHEAQDLHCCQQSLLSHSYPRQFFLNPVAFHVCFRGFTVSSVHVVTDRITDFAFIVIFRAPARRAVFC
jgi:hypothetical protein